MLLRVLEPIRPANSIFSSNDATRNGPKLGSHLLISNRGNSLANVVGFISSFPTQRY